MKYVVERTFSDLNNECQGLLKYQFYKNILQDLINKMKDKVGTAYNSEGRIFTDDGEVWYMSKDSRVNVTFPYVVPDNPEYVYRNKEKNNDI